MKRILIAICVTVLLIWTVVGASAASVDTDGAAPVGAGNTLSIDVSTTGWKNYDDIRCHIWELESGTLLNEWGSKSGKCIDTGNGIWSYDLEAHGILLESGKQYGVIFYAYPAMIQTYNLIAGTACLGDVAYCDGTTYENPVNSQLTTQAAFWRGQDASVFGPELKISSIGTLVGTCCPASTSPYRMFVIFLQETLLNARAYSGKDDQHLIDDTAGALGLKRDDIAAAIRESGVGGIEWVATESAVDAGVSDTAHTKGADSTAPVAQTGQNTDRIVCALTVILLALTVIIFVRRKTIIF